MPARKPARPRERSQEGSAGALVGVGGWLRHLRLLWERGHWERGRLARCVVMSSLELGVKCVNIPLNGQLGRAGLLTCRAFGARGSLVGWLACVWQRWRAGWYSGWLTHLRLSADALAFTQQARRLRSQ